MRKLYTPVLAALAMMIVCQGSASTHFSHAASAARQSGTFGALFLPPGPNSMLAFPVDLNGSYRAASSGAAGPAPSPDGIAWAATVPLAGGVGAVLEQNGANVAADNAVNGTFTPFNDATKTPASLLLTNANDTNGTKLEAEVELGGSWKPFQLGGIVPPFTTGDTFQVGWINSFNLMGVQLITDGSGNYRARLMGTLLSSGASGYLETNGTPVTFPAGTTTVRVTAQIIGGVMTGTVMPLDGPSALTAFPLGSTDGTNLDTASPWTLTYTNVGFLAGFDTHEHVAAGANASVSNFTTDAIDNVMFAFADDPYVRTVDGLIEYRIGQANLLQPVTGFQAFMNATAGQTFASATYAGPYSEVYPAVITSALDSAAYDKVPNQVNVTIAHLNFTPGAAEGAMSAGFRTNVGAFTNLFAGAGPLFSDILATTAGSNIVLIDNTVPTLAVPTLSGSGYDAPNVIVGNLDITTTASDGGSQPSGLAGRPAGTITWSDASTTPVPMTSLSGNSFKSTIPITDTTPNGTATLLVSVTDRAGNTATQTVSFNVSTVRVLLTITQSGVTANVNRVIKIKLGSTGGAHAPINIAKVVSFVSGVGTALITYQDLDLADDGLANNSISSGISLAYIKDPFFSLGKQITLGGTAANLTGTATLLMGDLTDNNVVNVSDLAVWAFNNGTTMSADTTLAQAATPRQANVDGLGTSPNVLLSDRNLILTSWLQLGDGDGVVGFRGPGDGSQTIEEVVAETGLNRKLVTTMDANHDRWITKEEVLNWNRGGDIK